MPLFHFTVVRLQAQKSDLRRQLQLSQQAQTSTAKQLKQKLEKLDTINEQLKFKNKLIKLKDNHIHNLTILNRATGIGGHTGGLGSAIKDDGTCSGYVPGQCVWGVCQWLKWVPNGWGSAYEWDDNARVAGYYVGPVPKVGAVGQTNANHVVMILAIKGDQVEVRGMNENGPYSVKTYWTPITRWNYIYAR